MDTLTLWGLFLAVGLGTFLIRLSFCSKRYHYNSRFIIAVICGVTAGLLLASMFKRPMLKRLR